MVGYVIFLEFVEGCAILTGSTKNQHELDIKKDTLQADMSIYANHQSLKYSKFDESRRLALEKIYSAIVSTSYPRSGFKHFHDSNFSKEQNKFCSLDFEAFSKTFKYFEAAFQNISTSYAILDQQSIFIEQDTENIILSTMHAILENYMDRHALLIIGHSKSQESFSQHKLSFNTTPLNFEEFYTVSVNEWVNVTTSARNQLKDHVRKILNPEE